MRKFATIVATGATAFALATPIAAVTSAASAAPSAVASASTTAPLAARRAPKIKIKTNPANRATHYGQQGVKVTAVLGKNAGKGKVKFSVDGTLVATQKVKKGKASYRMPADTAPGTHKVTAKFGKLKGSTKVIVHNSTLNLSAVEFTVSKAGLADYKYVETLPDLTGSVVFKGESPSSGYVDIYENGNVKGGSSSPDYCCMDPVEAGGVFEFSSFQFLERVGEEKAPGTYQYKAFYTPTSSFAEYIYSSFITVHVTP